MMGFVGRFCVWRLARVSMLFSTMGIYVIVHFAMAMIVCSSSALGVRHKQGDDSDHVYYFLHLSNLGKHSVAISRCEE